MELRKDELKKSLERKEATKCRFQIVRLEERIAPQHRSGHCGRARRHGFCGY